MNLLKSRNDKTRFFTAVICFAAVFYLLANQIIACSWDYPIWQVRNKNADSLYRFVKGDKAGYIDQKGHIVIKPTLDYFGNSGDEFVDGFLLAKVGEGSYLDKSGKVALETKYYRTWEFSEGLSVAMEEDNGKWGYIDKTGKFAISPRFESYPDGYVYSFSNGLAKISVKNKYGYIDRTGAFVIQPKFLEGTDFNEGFAVVIVEGPCVYVGEGPCEMFNAKTLGGENKYEKAPACKFTFIDKTGSIISAEKYDRAGSFSEGLASVMLNGKWGYIDKKGVMVIKPQFEQSQAFSDGLAAIKQGEKWGFIDKKGEIVITPQFDIVSDFSDGLASVGKWDKNLYKFTNYYYINKQGKQAFKGEFAQASHFFKGLAHVKFIYPKRKQYEYYMNGKYAYINVKGQQIFTYEHFQEY